MIINPLKLAGTYSIEIQPKRDTRGYFSRAYDKNIFAENGLVTDWVQENQSQTIRKNTIRGLHFQLSPFAETKLVRVVTGAILDVFVDIRKDSKTFSQWDSIELTEDNLMYVYIPKGFAHGFRTLTDITTVQYKVDSIFSSKHDCGIIWNDKNIGVNWGLDNPFISEKDSNLKRLIELDSLL
jgi:dTDP-4-dehydrorhamnose 3,5-epimerase